MLGSRAGGGVIHARNGTRYHLGRDGVGNQAGYEQGGLCQNACISVGREERVLRLRLPGLVPSAARSFTVAFRMGILNDNVLDRVLFLSGLERLAFDEG